ncbi:hypothetical protein ACIBCD_41455 [Nocardia brasiliensis]|uniref:hypothetical protein n=1 Tax=Nocardia brasiliensis TaxID=37326 RepID=UPI00378EC74C
MLFRAILIVVLLPAIAFAVLVVALISTTSMLAEGYTDLRQQCANAIGPDPSEPVTTTRAGRADAVPTPASRDARTTNLPTANPYASLTIPPTATDVPEWLGECIAAVQVADYRGPISQARNAGPAADCAGWLALAALGRNATGGGSAAPADAASFARWVTYHASLATGSAGCHYPATDALESRVVPEAGSAVRRGCVSPAGLDGRRPTAVVLPERIADQALCGQPVDRAAISPGDLVFWEFQRYTPRRVGVAVDTATVIAVDPVSGGLAQVLLTPQTAIGVKRVLEVGDG